MPVAATAQAQIRAGEFRAMPPDKIVRMMLPQEHLPIARVSFQIPLDPERLATPGLTLRAVRFYTASVPISADFCMQDEIVTETTPMPMDDRALLETPPRVLRETARIRLYRYRSNGEPCDGTKPHFNVSAMSPSQALEAVRALADAQQRTMKTSSFRQSFTISCSVMFIGSKGPCSTARGAMALFGLGEITGVGIDLQPEAHLRRRMRAPGSQLIQYSLPLLGFRSTSLHAIVNRGRVTHVDIAEGHVVF